jgi:hypothetical protein
MGSASGEFPYTVTLYQPTANPPVDDFGHALQNWTTVALCAARVWVASAAEQSGDPGEFGVRSARLLLREPVPGVVVGWRVMWKAQLWTIIGTEERQHDLLVTLEPA